MKSEQDELIKNEVLLILERNLGSVTASAYRKFYVEQDINTVLSSGAELLLELLGEKKQIEIFEPLLQKYNVKMNL